MYKLRYYGSTCNTTSSIGSACSYKTTPCQLIEEHFSFGCKSRNMTTSNIFQFWPKNKGTRSPCKLESSRSCGWEIFPRSMPFSRARWVCSCCYRRSYDSRAYYACLSKISHRACCQYCLISDCCLCSWHWGKYIGTKWDWLFCWGRDCAARNCACPGTQSPNCGI